MPCIIEPTSLRLTDTENDNDCNTRDNDKKMNDSTKLYLAPMRHGDLLLPPLSSPLSTHPGNQSSSNRTTRKNVHEIPRGWISLHHSSHRRCSHRGKLDGKNFIPSQKSAAIFLGRSDFLSSMFSACGCSKNWRSSRNKCKECRSVLSWAGNLSRRTLKINSSSNGANQPAQIQLSFRGCLAAIVIIKKDCRGEIEDTEYHRRCKCHRCNDYWDTGDTDVSVAPMIASALEEIETDDTGMRDPRKWSKPKRIGIGTRISLRYGEENLDFMVVSQEDLQNSVNTHDHCYEKRRDRIGTCSGSIPNNFKRAPSYSSGSSITKVLKDLTDGHNQSNRKNTRPLQQEQQKNRHILNDSNQQLQPSQAAVVENSNSDSCHSPIVTRIWFCPRGQDMPRKRIDILADRLLSLINSRVVSSSSSRPIHVQVVDRCFDATHWIVSERVPDLASVAKALPSTANSTEEALTKFLDENNVECFKPSWFDLLFSSLSSPNPSPLEFLLRPSAMDRWYGYIPASKKRQESDQKDRSPKRQRVCKDPSSCNLILSDFFIKLSKIYEQTSYLPHDEMKARQYHLIAGRLQKLDFEILSGITDRELRKIPFVGVSTAHMIQEVLQTNRLQRLECLRKDPIRMAMRDIMAIWGVGRATALKLIQQGFLNIHQIRKGILTGHISCFDRRQLIGVKCYEDLLEDMTRSEVESIFEQILLEARQILPDCEAHIMGSYRRGKNKLGDLDVLIVSKTYKDKVRGNFLAELVNGLSRKGHIVYHLNHLSGLESGFAAKSQEEHFHNKPQHYVPPLSKTFSSENPKSMERTSGASYMGVFLSPTVPGKHRRVDIKLWPYSQKPFASLYFTGGKYFNRSMRQWAKAKFNWKLDDKGLFDRITGERVAIDGCTEKDIFNKLQLVYKAPPDRKFFDDIHPLMHL